MRKPSGKKERRKNRKNRYNRKNQLIRRAAGGEVWDYTFDLQGNLIREAGPKEERQYLYDTENRQIRILSGGKEIQENRYDGEGLRAGLTVNGKKSTFLYVNRELYTESDETGTDISRYIRGKGLAGLEYQGRLYGVHQDEQLSTGWVTGEDGVPENAYEYDAFGTILGRHENVSNRLLYGGQQYDAETEQYYLRARYYNPVIGRFMQEDTCRGDGLNLYAYCANNPVMYYDPSGRNGVSCNTNTDAEKNAQQENVTGNGDREVITEKLNKEIEIIDSRGKCLGELDEIDLDNKIFYEDKTAKGLDVINPRTGEPTQTALEFALKQIYGKTKKRIINLFNSTGTRQAKTNKVDNVPDITELQEIKTFIFRLDGDSVELRAAVQESIERLQVEFPDYTFDATFGNH